MNAIMKKTCNIILDILIFLFGIILLISIYSDIQVKILKRDHADFFGFSTFEVQTGSMAPNINPSDVIIVKANTNPDVKDVITYKSGKDYITHRVVEAYKGTYVTKGDANSSKDEAIKQSQIVGTVVKVIPKFGVIRKTILNPIVLITLIITIYLISFIFGKKNNNTKVDNMLKKLRELLDKSREEVEILRRRKNIKKFTQEQEDEIKRAVEEQLLKEDINIRERFDDTKATEEELDKTVIYRKISVDKEDLNPPIVIKQNTPEEEIEVLEEADLTEVVEKVEEEIKDEDKEVVVKLEYLNKRKKKFNNIIEKIMFSKEEELKELVSCLNNNEKLRPNEASIKDAFTKIYIDAKYYNYTGEVNVSYNGKNMNCKLEEVLNETATDLIKKYKGSDNKYKEKVENYRNIFITVLYVESYYLSENDTEVKINNYKKKILKYLKDTYRFEEELIDKIKELMLIQKTYSKINEMSLKNMETNTFELKYNNIPNVKNMYGLTLNHNINFSKIYSDYIVDKTYDEGIVAEDKVLVTANILLTRIAKDMIDTEFKNRYLLYLPATLYEKDNKLNKVLKLLDDELVKKCTLLLVKYDTLISNKKKIKELKKLGYRIALIFDDYVQIKAKDKPSILLAEYIFVDKKINKVLGISSMVPKDLKQHVIQEDIVSKVDISGGHN